MTRNGPTAGARRRWLDAARIAWGAWLCAPGGAADLETDRRTATAVRLAGVRQAAQAAVATVRPTPRVMRWGGYVDLIHAATMMVAGGLMPRHRKLLLADSVIAAGWGAAGLRAGRS